VWKKLFRHHRKGPNYINEVIKIILFSDLKVVEMMIIGLRAYNLNTGNAGTKPDALPKLMNITQCANDPMEISTVFLPVLLITLNLMPHPTK